ncbi:FAD-dependent oxidoreductase [Streptomyces olivaceus]|uniref:flavin monoamine oxidase family protein n=1 Tax=Streptomyces olivaceus TaxID=47716 RepID=UPI001CCBD5D8|nr:NAD(P)/FAD-dependent oxidoreductase [Streptomyces olivaceus]MBZ6083672.1 FAD-dependent oxidoreductase [Streptomyces olivaceus]
MDEMYDVAVIGAGFAGATAARELATRGHTVVVLEARDVIGGRTHTSRLKNGELVELGGTFVHWSQPHVWSEITRYGLTADLVDGTEAPEWALTPHDGGLRWTPAEEQLERETRLMEQFFEGSWNALPRPYQPGHGGEAERLADHKLISERLSEMGLSPGDRDLLTTFFLTHLAGEDLEDLDRGSVLSELKMWAPAGHTYAGFMGAVFGYRLRRGTVSLLSAILEDAGSEVRTKSVVRSVKSMADHALITLESGGAVRARAVVLATPSGVWADLDMKPALSENRVAVSRAGMQIRYVSKGYMVVRGEPRAVTVMPKQPHPIVMMATSHRNSGDEQTMVFWGTERLGDPTDLVRLQDAVRSLLPDARVSEAVARVYDGHDPLTRGGWGLIRAGEQTRIAPDATLSAAEGRVFFATADIATGWQGYIDGAIETGIRAARQVREFFLT